MSRTVKLKLDAPVTYAALQSLTNISQETIFQALDGNQTAAAEVADFRIKQTQRAPAPPLLCCRGRRDILTEFTPGNNSLQGLANANQKSKNAYLF